MASVDHTKQYASIDDVRIYADRLRMMGYRRVSSLTLDDFQLHIESPHGKQPSEQRGPAVYTLYWKHPDDLPPGCHCPICSTSPAHP